MPDPEISGSIVFLHAHPDDEAIFTGGTMALLARSGARVTVVFATDDRFGSGSMWRTRRAEAERAAEVLGLHRVCFLGFTDSGLGPDLHPDCFAATDADLAAKGLITVLDEESADAVVTYEPGGIYGHPDHLAVHRIGRRAAEMAGTPTLYESTVDREHLHFVATHLVDQATEALMSAGPADGPNGLLLAAWANDGRLAGGTPTVAIDLAVDVSGVLATKRAAMAAHPSQIAADSEVLAMDDATFAAVYGQEWYLRRGPRSLIDALDRQ